MKKTKKLTCLHTLFIDHTYMFRSPSATILRVYGIKQYKQVVCVEFVHDQNHKIL
jgi:hypothetical protein